MSDKEMTQAWSNKTGMRRIAGRCYPLGLDNVDTDLIIPARHLKTLSRAGLGRFAFEGLREKDPANIFDAPALAGAPVLVAGRNFGCGSSREHAVWALKDLGIQAVLAISFSDIFAGNAFKNGLAAICLAADVIDGLLAEPCSELQLDLEAQTLSFAGASVAFEMDPFRKACLLCGLDEIALTLEHEPCIAAFEQSEAMTPVPRH